MLFVIVSVVGIVVIVLVGIVVIVLVGIVVLVIVVVRAFSFPGFLWVFRFHCIVRAGL